MTDEIDLNNVISRRVAAITLEEHPDVIKAKIEADRRQKRIEDYQGIAVFSVFLVGLVAVSILCSYIAMDSTSTAETKRWAQTMLSGLVTGSVSFVAGRKIGSK